MHYRSQWSNHLRAQGLGKGDKQPANATIEYGTLYLYFAVAEGGKEGTEMKIMKREEEKGLK